MGKHSLKHARDWGDGRAFSKACTGWGDAMPVVEAAPVDDDSFVIRVMRSAFNKISMPAISSTMTLLSLVVVVRGELLKTNMPGCSAA